MIFSCSRYSLQEKGWHNSVKREDRQKKPTTNKQTCHWYWEFVLGWKVKTRNFNCLNSKNVSSAYWSNTDISMCRIDRNLYKYQYLFPEKVQSQMKRMLDIKKNQIRSEQLNAFLPTRPRPPVVSRLTWIHSPQVQLSTKSHTPHARVFFGNKIKYL